MKILITTVGTRGDIQPFVALARGLMAAGNTVAVCAPAGFGPFIESYGVTLLPMDNEVLNLTQAALTEASTLRDGIRIGRQMRPAIRRMMDDEWRAAHGWQPDLIIAHPKCLGSPHAAERLQIPVVLAIPLPCYTPTAAFSMPLFPPLPFGGWVNRATYGLNRLSSLMFAATINDFRRTSLALPPISRLADPLLRADGRPIPILYPYSPALLPVPSDFPPHVHVTGTWFLDHPAGWAPSADLVRFLDAGPPPIYVGFGSMRGSAEDRRAALVIDALAQTGQRGVLASGWGGLTASQVSDRVVVLDEVPHDWLFPQIAAVMHHGGAGTTAAGVRAGKPSIVCPFLGDQPFWGRVIQQRGVGPAPIPQKRLTRERITAAITTVVQDTAMGARAAALGEAVRREDGVGCAVAILESLQVG
jgi:sterol 3beta-glucosyltransferase